MLSYLKVLTFTLLSFSFAFQASARFADIKLSNHMEDYSEFDSYVHESIDEVTHSHSHKHSEDEEEHEHSHEHGQVTSVDLKLVPKNHMIQSTIYEVLSLSSYLEKSLISNAHPASLFRPPIV